MKSAKREIYYCFSRKIKRQHGKISGKNPLASNVSASHRNMGTFPSHECEIPSQALKKNRITC